MTNCYRILLVDDDKTFSYVLKKEIGRMGHEITLAGDGQEALEKLRQSNYDLVLLDQRLPGQDGKTVLVEIKKLDPMVEVIILTGYGTIENAVEAMKLGAYHYLTKPCKLSELEVVLKKAYEKRVLREENQNLKITLEKKGAVHEIIGESPAIKAVIERIEKIAPVDLPVLVQGESGTGKELVVRAIHQKSHRASNLLLTINCGALQETLLESELFGHQKGAFTGAIENKRGLFEIAHKGTLFLDEIGEMSPSMQAKLLRTLQFGEVRRLGEARPIKVDVRVIAATNRNLAEDVTEGRFRQDLYYRLNVLNISLPPLRTIPEDIPLLIRHFLQNSRVSGKKVKSITPEALQYLQEYSWPGNIRELENTVERLIILSQSDTITLRDVLDNIPLHQPSLADNDSAPLSLREMERNQILRVLAQNQGNKTKTAKDLGITLKTLYNKLSYYRIGT
jgi:DNA-binding NtrC family response regulator